MANYKEVLQERKADSTVQVLFKVARLINEHAIAIVNARQDSTQRLRPSHMALIPHLDLEGTRITTLAERMEISKQAVSQVAVELEAMGIVTREPDPEDGRAKLVRFTTLGKKSMLEGLEILKEIEGDLATVIGERRMKDLGKTLTMLLTHIEDEDSFPDL